MNTSNKILAGFFTIVFLVPVFMLIGFSKKIKNGQFMVVKRESYEDANFRSGSFNSYKVIKLIAPPGRALKCNFQYSDSMYYSYNMGSGDSIMVYNMADTVFVQYINPKRTQDANSMTELYVDMKLPAIENLIVENAEATIISMDTSGNKNLSVEILGTGVLNIGVPEENKNDNDISLQTPYKLNQLSVKATHADLALGKNVNIRQLKLQGNGASVISIAEGAVIEEIQGNLSDSSSVKASWKYVKRLATLTQN